MPNKPMPRIDAVDKPFWNACNEERVVVQRCSSPPCGRFVYYPRVCCPHCHGDTLEWTEVTGSGTVASHTTIHRPHHDGFADEVPYLFAAVRLDEGPIVYARLEAGEGDPGRIIDRRVEPIFHPHGEGQKLLAFRLQD